MSNPISSALEEAYEIEHKKQKYARSKIGCIASLLMVLPAINLDLIVYPDNISQFLVIRLSCEALLILILLLHYVPQLKKYITFISFAWPTIINISTCVMIYLSDGAASPYYAGINLVLIGVTFLLPFKVIESVLLFMITIAIYIFTCFISGTISDSFSHFYNNISFLIFTGVVSCIVSYFNTFSRYKEFELSFDLNIRNQQLIKLETLRTNFFSNISHELRTPLTLILSPVHDLLTSETIIPNKARKVLTTTYNNALRLLKLVNDLLEVIRIEEGKSQLNLQPLYVDASLSEIVGSIMDLSEKKNIDISTHFDCQNVQILADNFAFEKIFMNLLHNAIKFSSDNGHITLSSRHDLRRIRIIVKDDGIGINSEELPYIFDRFRQADSSSTRQYQGSGLGLSLAKDLAEQLGGEIGVRSEPGIGTTFSLSFPIHKITNDLPHNPSISAEPADALQKLYRLANRSGMMHLDTKRTIPNAPATPTARDSQSDHSLLIVEDENDLLEYLVAALEDDYKIFKAVDGEIAYQLVKELKPSLIVLDLMIPKIDGLDLCAKIKNDESLRNIKIILLTARIDENAKITALKYGADDFLTKPFSTLELKTRIKNMLITSEYEQKLVNSNKELNLTLNELKETQTQLIQSEKTNALEYLSAGILHEINNPLNYTLTALQLARSMPEATNNEMLNEILIDMHEGMVRIKDIVSDLQTFAHPSSVEKQTTFKFHNALKTALNFTSQDATNVSITDNTDKEAKVIGSKNHIVQVLINLITNAIKAIRSVESIRKGEILINSRVLDNRIYISVRDNGNGINQEILEKIFDPFFTTRDVGEGMGLGLSVSQTIIKSHNGKLRAQSVAGEWTEFSFDLELSQSA